MKGCLTVIGWMLLDILLASLLVKYLSATAIVVIMMLIWPIGITLTVLNWITGGKK